jgi:hypothetical protein
MTICFFSLLSHLLFSKIAASGSATFNALLQHGMF